MTGKGGYASPRSNLPSGGLENVKARINKGLVGGFFRPGCPA